MKLKYAIPSLIGLSTTLTACADPIIGEWIGESITIDGDTVNIPYEYNGVELFSSLDLTVEADLTGALTQESYDGTNSVSVAVTNNGGGNYAIASTDPDAGGEDLDCNLSGSKLSCTSGSTTVDFNKGTK